MCDHWLHVKIKIINIYNNNREVKIKCNLNDNTFFLSFFVAILNDKPKVILHIYKGYNFKLIIKKKRE